MVLSSDAKKTGFFVCFVLFCFLATSNLEQKFVSLNTLLHHKPLPAIIAGFIQVQLFLPSLFIYNVNSGHLYVVW